MGQIVLLRHDLGHRSVQGSHTRSFGGHMPGVDHRQIAIQRTAGPMMAHIARDEDVGPTRSHLDERGARAGGDGNGRHRACWVSGVPNRGLQPLADLVQSIELDLPSMGARTDR